MPTQKNALQLKNELDSIVEELGLKSISYLPSPKCPNPNIRELAANAIAMLKIYQRFLAGDATAPIREIFVGA